MTRKTSNVSEMVDYVNSMLAATEANKTEFRSGAMMVIEEILHRTGNYNGFRYLSQKEVNGNPGIWLNDDGTHNYPTCFDNTDRTRVQYGCKS